MSVGLGLRQVLVVTPTSDGNSVDVEYEASNERLDTWARQHGAPSVSFLTCLCPGLATPRMRSVYTHWWLAASRGAEPLELTDAHSKGLVAYGWVRLHAWAHHLPRFLQLCIPSSSLVASALSSWVLCSFPGALCAI
jgi:hypothetical protein